MSEIRRQIGRDKERVRKQDGGRESGRHKEIKIGEIRREREGEMGEGRGRRRVKERER